MLTAIESLLYSCFHDHFIEHVNVVFFVAWILRRCIFPVLCLRIQKIGGSRPFIYRHVGSRGLSSSVFAFPRLELFPLVPLLMAMPDAIIQVPSSPSMTSTLSVSPSPSRCSSPTPSSDFSPVISKREYLLAQIRQKDAIIESLLKQVCFVSFVRHCCGLLTFS